MIVFSIVKVDNLFIGLIPRTTTLNKKNDSKKYINIILLYTASLA